MSEMYDRINALCKNNHTNITRLCKELNIGRSALSELASGRTRSLSAVTMSKIAEYFGVTTDYIITGSFDRNAGDDDARIQQMIAFVRGNRDLQTILEFAKEATPAQMKQMISIIKTIRGIE